MNPAKKNNGWILCPSKSFPGKFYYFNVVNGETAWSLNEAEKQFLRNPPIEKIGKSHCYPEPKSPPEDDTPPAVVKPTRYTSPILQSTASPIYPRDISSHTYPSNSSNISLYQPKYAQQTYPIQPIQIQVPMIIGSDFQNCGPNVLMILMNQNTRPTSQFTIEERKTCPIPVETLKVEPDRELFVQSSNKPLGQHIVNYEKPVLNFNNENKIVKPCHSLYQMSTPNKAIVPTFPHDQSSIDTCGLSKSNISYDFNVKNQSRPIIRMTPKPTPERKQTSNVLARNPFEHPNIFAKSPPAHTNTFAQSSRSSVSANSPSSHPNIFAKRPSPHPNIFAQSSSHPNIYTKSSSSYPNIFAKSPSSHPNMCAKNTTFHPRIFAQSSNVSAKSSTSHPNIFAKSKSSHTNLFAKSPSAHTSFAPRSSAHPKIFPPSTTNVFVPKSPYSNKVFKASHEEEQYTPDNLENPINFRTNPFQNLSEKSALIQSNNVDISKRLFNAHNLTPPKNYIRYGTYSKEKSTLLQGSVVPNQDTDRLEYLPANDLRRILTAKKRTSTDCNQAEIIAGKKIKTEIQEIPSLIPKKRVTFNLIPERYSDQDSIEDFSDNHDDVDIKLSTDSEENIEPRHLAMPSNRNEKWYIVVDTNVLIEEFEFLDNFAKSDPKYNLMIPSRVMSEAVALSRGECRERYRVTLARNSLRKLATPQPHIIVQYTAIDDGMGNISIDGSIINCCLERMERNAHVILVTNDESLQFKAKSLNITCSNIQQIKDNVPKKPEIHFDIKKIKISVPNLPENTYTQQEVPTHAFKKKLFDSSIETTLKDENSMEESPFSSNNADKDEWNYYSDDIVRDSNELRELPRLFQIQNVITKPTRAKELLTTDKKESFRNVPNSKDTVSFFQNNDVQKLPVTEGGQSLEKGPLTVSCFFQNEAGNAKGRSTSSIFKQAIDKFSKDLSQSKSNFEIDKEQLQIQVQSKSSIFELEGIEKLKPCPVNMKPSIFEDRFKPCHQRLPIFDYEKYNNIQIELDNSIFGNRETPNKEISKKSIFEREKYKSNESQLTSPIFEHEKYKNIEVQLDNSLYENDQVYTNPSAIKSSVFDTQKYKNTGALSRPSIFDDEIYKNIEVQLNNSICENGLFTIVEDPKKIPIFETEKYKNKVQSQTSIFNDVKHKNTEVQLHPPVFGNEKQKNKGVQLPVFEIDEKVEPVLPDEIKNGFDLEGSIKKILVQNNIKENTIEERSEEFVCSLKQIMEECLTSLLQHTSFIHKSMPPPWSFHEALQCTSKLYGSHTTVHTIVNFLNGVLNAKGEVKSCDIVKSVGCGFLLIRYLKKITKSPITEALTDAENSLRNVIENDPAAQPFKTPVFNRCDIYSEQHINRRNFVKKRSEVLDYLKRHFPAWANYDETLENVQSKAVWGQNYKHAKVVRTLGKNLSLLELNNSKTMTMNTHPNDIKIMKYVAEKENDNSQENAEKHCVINKHDNNNNDGKNNNENIDNQIFNNSVDQKTPTKVIEKIRNILKLKRKDKPKMEENTVGNYAQNTNIVGANQQDNLKETGPKIVRLFHNVKITKELIKEKSGKDCQKPIFDLDYSTHGHTFGTNKNVGPKVVRNITMINSFEEKLKNKKISLDLDKLDYSVISKSDDDENTDNDCVSMNIDRMNIETNVTDFNDKDEQNDIYATNDKSKCEANSFYSYFNEKNTRDSNNGSHSMSFDNCVTNYPLKEVNDDGKNDNSSMNDNHTSDYVSCLTNMASYGANDDIFSQKRDYYEFSYDAVNDESKVHKDDTTHDSGYENDILQANPSLESFVHEVSSTFKLVLKFIGESIKELRDANLLDSKRRILHSKANAAHIQIIEIIDKLKSIIRRDATTLQTLLAEVGSQASNVEVVTRFRHDVTKLLEQAQKMEKLLRFIATATNGSIDSAATKINSKTSVRLFNVFG